MSSEARNNQNHPQHAPAPSALTGHSPPATPQSPLPSSQNDDLQLAMQKLTVKDSNVRCNTIRTTNLSTHKRRRKDRDVSHHLLTPPLTPSSSIRTNASTDFPNGKQDEKIHALQELRDPEATRFLYLENISRTASPLPLQSALTDALARICFRRTSTSPPSNEGPNDTASCVKGFFLRHIKTTGTLFLAFHDVRDAVAAKAVLNKKTKGPLVKYLGEERPADGSQSSFSCHFVTPEELVKAIGSSNFLATTDGGFALSATVVNDTEGAQPQDLTRVRPYINTHALVEVLESYGDLRLLKPESRSDDNETFLVEFFDVRDAYEAYTSLNDQVVFGMKLCTSGRVPPDVQENDGFPQVSSAKQTQDSTEPPQSNHQPSISESHIGRPKATIGPAGEASQMRGRFIGQAFQPRPRAVSAGGRTTSSSSPTRPSEQQPKAPSPTVFYTSFDLPEPYPLDSPPVHDVPASKHSGYNENQAPEPNEMPKLWEPQQTCSIVDCRYCPSKGQDSTLPQFPINHHIDPMFANSVSFSMHPMHAPFVAPESETQGAFVAAGGGWPTEYIAAVQGIGNNLEMFPPAFLPAIPTVPVEHCLPGHAPDPSFVQNGLVFPSISPALHAHPHAFADQQPPVALGHHVFVNNATDGLSPDLDVFSLSLTNPGVNDRNFLNIARIEEGLDTRTTVMIKNIPNKMSSRDLTHYINEVCPRKIDFLYLRMDFKNGCNVGYAFVNFIRVQDMLKFAKKRLGVKWNMFSSEKVLQMSYANYQGKEALVEKFKNSCIMDEREEWRPRIFYSNGPEQGLPEPFPAPTHLRRKERSSHNRGALYVGCMTNGLVNGSGYLNNGPLRRHEHLPNSKYLEHRNSGHMERSAKEAHAGTRRRKTPYERF